MAVTGFQLAVYSDRVAAHVLQSSINSIMWRLLMGLLYHPASVRMGFIIIEKGFNIWYVNSKYHMVISDLTPGGLNLIYIDCYY